MKLLLLIALALAALLAVVSGEDGLRIGKKKVRTWVVTGATGRTGALVYKLLKKDPGVSVRAVVRNRTKAQMKLGCGACADKEGKEMVVLIASDLL